MRVGAARQLVSLLGLSCSCGAYSRVCVCSPHSEPTLSFPLLFASAFMSIFSVVIAFFKDIPDVKGDKSSSIQTLSVRLGVRFMPLALAVLHSASACH